MTTASIGMKARHAKHHARLGRLQSWKLPRTVRAMRFELPPGSERLPARISRAGRETPHPQLLGHGLVAVRGSESNR
jgi:hypothetical protein